MHPRPRLAQRRRIFSIAVTISAVASSMQAKPAMLADIAQGAADDAASDTAWPCELRNKMDVGVMSTFGQMTQSSVKADTT
jgi:hypothetical protein